MYPTIRFFTLKLEADGCIESYKENCTDLTNAIQQHSGGIHLLIGTPPCTDFSLAGNGNGPKGETGHLFQVVYDINDFFQHDSNTLTVVENTRSSHKNHREMQNVNHAIPEAVTVHGTAMSCMSRVRMIRMNFPPSERCELCHPEMTAQSVLNANHLVNPQLIKFNTPLHSKGGNQDFGIWENNPAEPTEPPVAVPITVEELTRAFGYPSEFGRCTAGPGIRNRLKAHVVLEDSGESNYIVELTGAGQDENGSKLLTDSERMGLLGNSVLPGMFKEVLRTLQMLFPKPEDEMDY